MAGETPDWVMGWYYIFFIIGFIIVVWIIAHIVTLYSRKKKTIENRKRAREKKEMETMYCPSCGKEIKTFYKYCEYCGEMLDSSGFYKKYSK